MCTAWALKPNLHTTFYTSLSTQNAAACGRRRGKKEGADIFSA